MFTLQSNFRRTGTAIALAALLCTGSAFAADLPAGGVPTAGVPATPVPATTMDTSAAEVPALVISATDPVPEVTCLATPAKLSDSEIEAFLASPAALLDEHTAGGLPMSNDVRFLAASDSRTLDPLLGLLDDANPSQARGIAAGLARAAFVCGAEEEVYAAIIQARVAEIDNEDFLLAFVEMLGDIQTAAIPPGGAPGAVPSAPGIGGGGNAGPGTRGMFGDDAVAQGVDDYSFNRRSLFVVDNGDGATRPVSPTQVSR